MEKELRELIVYRYGVETYRKMIIMRRQIKDDRARAERLRKRKIRNLFEGIAIVLISTFGIGFLSYIGYFIITYK